MRPSSSFTNFLLIAALLLLHKRAAAEDDWSGFHGYERDALLDLKARFNNAFLDANWTGIMCYMNNTPYWYGVKCLEGRVTGLILDSMGLVGTIEADALVNLTELQTLSFRNNSITGNMMEFAHNQKLRDIDLSRNRFDGEISSSLLNLNSLESLQLQDNSLTGPIPGFNQSSLTRFNVSNNNLSGEIPETRTLQSFGISSYFGNENLCGPPTPTRCIVKHSVSEANNDDSGEKRHDNGRFVAILVAVDVVVLIIILFLFIVYYNKYKKLRKEMKGRGEISSSSRDEEQVQAATEKRTPEGERGKLVMVESDGTTTFDLDDLLRASAEGLGKGNFGNCYKAMMEVGPAVAVKRLRDLKPLNRDEFVRQVTAIADQKHPNLLPLLAYFYSEEEKLFVYRFASNGNLFNRLHGN